MRPRILSTIALTSLVATIASAQLATNEPLSTPSSPAEFSRRGHWEAYGFAQAVGMNQLITSTEIYGAGGGVGYNFAQHFTLSGDLSLSSANTEGIFSDSETTVLFMAHVYADWNILKYRVTPVISPGFGLGAFANRTGAAFDQTIGIGLRVDAGERLMFKLMFRVGALETTSNPYGNHPDGWASLGVSLAAGYRF